jgi:PIN domain nuclease of toxin-antitoxin system
VRVLLDTHALLWWALNDRGLSRPAREALADAENIVYVSAASAWEIAIKTNLGKLPGAERFAAELGAYLVQQGFAALDITVGHALRAGALPGPHRDPFDRMLIAQAQAENLTLVSNESVFDHYGVVRLW